MWTKEKTAKYQREYYSKNKEKFRLYFRKYREINGKKNRDKYCPYNRAYSKKYFATHRDRIKFLEKKYYRNNPRKYSLRSAKFYLNNSEDCKVRSRKYRSENKERCNYLTKRWRIEHPKEILAINARRRALKKNAPGSSYTTAQHIKWRWEMWGGMCYICGRPAVATDHVIPLNKKGTHFPANLRPACFSCNNSKGTKSLKEFLLERKKELEKALENL